MFSIFRRKPKTKQIRPMTLQDFTGQDNTKMVLGIALNGAKQRGTNLEHVIIYGPPGLGKTTLANIVATEMKASFHSSIGSVLQKQSDLIDLFEGMYDGDILFIDEIHRVPIKVEELLYTAMEDGYIDLNDGRMTLPKFTLIGATTRLGDLSEPLRDRFGIQLRMDYYKPHHMAEIAQRTAKVLGFDISAGGTNILASRSRGTPRVLNNFIRRSIDVAQAGGASRINETVAIAALDMLEIDYLGLDRMDRRILQTMYSTYNCKPVGLSTLSVSVGESASTIQEVYEPYLIQSGLVVPTSSGRMLSQKAIDYIRGVE